MTSTVFKPMGHQAYSLKHGRKQPRVFDTSDAGTGKTAVCVWGFSERRSKGGGCMLVLGVRSTLRSVWAADVAKFAPHLTFSLCPAEKREAGFAADADIYITNHDAAKWLEKKPKSFFAKFDTLILDESSAYKHHTSQRSKALAKIKQKALVVGISSDRLFPLSGQKVIAESLGGELVGGKLHVIDSEFGHDGFLIESQIVGPLLAKLLKS